MDTSGNGEGLLPLAAQLRLLCDPTTLRKEIESALSPVAEKRGGGNAKATMSSERRPSMIDEPIEVTACNS